jgi:hypothetical protein
MWNSLLAPRGFRRKSNSILTDAPLPWVAPIFRIV